MIDKYSIHKFSQKLLQKSIFRHLKEYLGWRAGSEKLESNNFAPISINLDLTTGCNFNCTHCIDGDIINTGRSLEFDYIKKLIGDWSKNGLKSVILIGGGEPILYPYFEEVVKFLKERSLEIGIVTNGTRIDKIENIVHLLGKKDWVRLSLDAGSNEVFQKIHNPKLEVNFDEIMGKVKKMRQAKNDFQLGFSFLVIGDGKYINGLPLTNNINEISLAARLAKENDFNYFSVKPFIDPAGARETEISRENLNEIKEEINKARKYEDENFKVIESINLLVFYDDALNEAMKNQSKICHAQFFRLVVTPDGIFQCSLWRGFNNNKIIDTNQEINDEYYQEFHKNRLKLIEGFNAKEVCGKTRCLYSPFNSWVEKLVEDPERLEKLEPIDDFDDYFL